MATQLTNNDFDMKVTQSQVPVLVDFWAPWCGPCQFLGPVMEKLSEQLKGKAEVYKVNVDENPELAAKFGVRGIPTVIAFEKGEISNTLVGVRSEQEYLDALKV